MTVGVDARLDELCRQALSLEPERRPDAAAFAAALQAIARGVGAPSPAPDAAPAGARALRGELRVDAQGLVSSQALWRLRKELGTDGLRRLIGDVPVLRFKEERPLQGVDGSAYLDRLAPLLSRDPAASAVTLGRAADRDLVVSLTSISKRQARFERRGDGWVIIEEGSRNGTTLNGVALEAGQPQPLACGDEVCLSAHLVVEVLSAEALVDWVQERAGWSRR